MEVDQEWQEGWKKFADWLDNDPERQQQWQEKWQKQRQDDAKLKVESCPLKGIFLAEGLIIKAEILCYS